jgi:hypothetical protein
MYVYTVLDGKGALRFFCCVCGICGGQTWKKDYLGHTLILGLYSYSYSYGTYDCCYIIHVWDVTIRTRVCNVYIYVCVRSAVAIVDFSVRKKNHICVRQHMYMCRNCRPYVWKSRRARVETQPLYLCVMVYMYMRMHVIIDGYCHSIAYRNIRYANDAMATEWVFVYVFQSTKDWYFLTVVDSKKLELKLRLLPHC